MKKKKKYVVSTSMEREGKNGDSRALSTEREVRRPNREGRTEGRKRMVTAGLKVLTMEREIRRPNRVQGRTGGRKR